jgi:hypothetical protein
VLVPVAIWIYTLVFAFSSLWFSHYTLNALDQLRQKNNATDTQMRSQLAPELIANKTPTQDTRQDTKEIKEI